MTLQRIVGRVRSPQKAVWVIVQLASFCDTTEAFEVETRYWQRSLIPAMLGGLFKRCNGRIMLVVPILDWAFSLETWVNTQQVWRDDRWITQYTSSNA